MKVRSITLFLVILALTSFLLYSYAFAYYLPDFLCNMGLEFYQQGRIDEALRQFKIALLAQPDYPPALEYINMIKEGKTLPIPQEEGKARRLLGPKREASVADIDAILNFYQKQKEMMELGQPFIPSYPPQQKIYPVLPKEETEGARVEPAPEEEVTLPKKIVLDSSLVNMSQPFEIEKGASVIIYGRNISRFLATEENIISVEKIGADEILVTGSGIGYTFLHIWDDNGRWTTEWLGVFPRPKGLSAKALAKRRAEKTDNFKLRYRMNWWSHEGGRRIESLDRTSYTWAHEVGLEGPTPYGNLDSRVYLRQLRSTTDVTYFTLGMDKGHIGNLEDFSFRLFDYYPTFTSLAFPGASLRGAIATLPAFDKKSYYSVFWGRESGGRYANLSPGLSKTRDSFLEGANFNYSPTKKQDYQFSFYHGYGEDRDDYLRSYGLDGMANWDLGLWNLGYELAYDSKYFAHLFRSRYSRPKLNFTAELRDIDKDFVSMTGRGWRVGQLGGVFSLNYSPSQVWNMYTNLNVYRDRAYPAEDNKKRWNEDFNWSYGYRFNSLTSMLLNYNLRNSLGLLSQNRYQSPGIGLYRTFKFIKDIYTYASYYHQENKSFTSPSSDYINERFYAGLRFSLWGDLYYFLNKEINWLNERQQSNHVMPNALETGVDWTGRFSKIPLSGTFRFTYHDEEDAASDLSFYPGEDYIEGYTELTYRPAGDKEIFGSCRMRNVWAETTGVDKRITMDFNAGMRYLWDTGVSWEAVCNIEGYVFKDLNSDGLRQRDERPIEGVRVCLGKSRCEVSDVFGYYKFKGVRGRRAYVDMDMSTLPRGYLLTVPASQEISIVNHQDIKVYFGMMIRTEISGVIFEDENGNGMYDRQEKGVGGAIVTLEDGQQAVTSPEGRYTFYRPSPGEHTISLDLNSLPVYYLPKTAITQRINLLEGTTYIYNIPLNRIEDR